MTVLIFTGLVAVTVALSLIDFLLGVGFYFGVMAGAVAMLLAATQDAEGLALWE